MGLSMIWTTVVGDQPIQVTFFSAYNQAQRAVFWTRLCWKNFSVTIRFYIFVTTSKKFRSCFKGSLPSRVISLELCYLYFLTFSILQSSIGGAHLNSSSENLCLCQVPSLFHFHFHQDSIQVIIWNEGEMYNVNLERPFYCSEGPD